ncbi:MAG: sugar ABC transporter substrate-binding protein [Clostridia bacterium]|nr:sugar ABC transporter substrate-binding protein [Clostridia bacterium]
MKKRVWSIVLIAATILAVFGVGASAAKTKIDVMFWWDIDNPSLVEMKKQFNAKYPDIEVNYINVPSKEFYDKLLTMIVGGKAPDVAMLGMDKLATFASKGALTDLTKYMETQYPVTDLFDTVKPSLMYKGKYYALPRDVTTNVLYYNKKIFREHGVAYPKAGWTWDDFLAAAKKTTHFGPDGKAEHFGFNYESYADSFIHWMWQNGGDFLNADYTKSALSNKESVEALQFLVDLRLKYHVCPTIPEAQSLGREEDLFRTGRLAMYIGGVSRTQKFAAQADLDWDVVPNPVGKKGPASRIWTNLWIVPRGTKNLDAAWKFVSFVGGPEGQRIAAKTNMGIPALKSIASEPDFLSQAPDHRQYFLDAFKYGKVFPIFPEGQEYWDIVVKRELEPVWLGQRSPAEAAAAIDKIANDTLFK